jgi:SAM-dependent methyltransferase
MKTNTYQKLASYYDNIYNSKFYRQYALFIKKIAKKNKIIEPVILDCACGTGKLIAELVKNGISKSNASGFDVSKEMIAIAQKNNPAVKFHVCDFKNFFHDKDSSRNYSIITCTFDAINYILKKEDLKKFFINVNGKLKNGGVFIFDFNTIYKKVKKEVVKSGSIKYSSKIENGFWHLNIEIRENDETYEENHKERLYSFCEIKKLLANVGFEKVKMYKNFNDELKQVGKEQRLIVIALK